MIDDATLSISDLRALYESVSGWIRFADTKSGLQLTATGLVLGLVTDSLLSDRSVLSDASGATIVLVVVAYSLLIMAVVANLIALGPRLKEVSPSDSLLFFVDISNRSFIGFRDEVTAAPLETIKHQYAAQIHELASIATKKFRRVQIGTALILAATTFGALAWLVEGVFNQ